MVPRLVINIDEKRLLQFTHLFCIWKFLMNFTKEKNKGGEEEIILLQIKSSMREIDGEKERRTDFAFYQLKGKCKDQDM